MEVLSKGIIEREIVPYLSRNKRGPTSQLTLSTIVSAIFHRLKTGCQWRMLPVSAFCSAAHISWQGIYHHHHKWVRDGSWRRVWVHLLRHYRHRLDTSSVQLDGSVTLAKKQGEAIAYQRRKRGRTTNILLLADNNGQPLALATPQAGNHHDLYGIEMLFAELCALLKEAHIPLDGLFLNADSGFDAAALKLACYREGICANIDAHSCYDPERSTFSVFDEELYRRRVIIERTNAWIDGFKTLLIRYEGKLQTWIAAHFMAFAILLLRKLDSC